MSLNCFLLSALCFCLSLPLYNSCCILLLFTLAFLSVLLLHLLSSLPCSSPRLAPTLALVLAPGSASPAVGCSFLLFWLFWRPRLFSLSARLSLPVCARPPALVVLPGMRVCLSACPLLRLLRCVPLALPGPSPARSSTQGMSFYLSVFSLSSFFLLFSFFAYSLSHSVSRTAPSFALTLHSLPLFLRSAPVICFCLLLHPLPFPSFVCLCLFHTPSLLSQAVFLRGLLGLQRLCSAPLSPAASGAWSPVTSAPSAIAGVDGASASARWRCCRCFLPLCSFLALVLVFWRVCGAPPTGSVMACVRAPHVLGHGVRACAAPLPCANMACDVCACADRACAAPLTCAQYRVRVRLMLLFVLFSLLLLFNCPGCLSVVAFVLLLALLETY